MKKNMASNLFFIASTLFYLAAVIGFATGNDMAVMWLCLGSCFLCLGSVNKKKESEDTKEDKDEGK